MIRLATYISIFVSVILIVSTAVAQEKRMTVKHSYTPERGFVPDEATALTIAEAILLPIYGGSNIQAQKPLHAILMDGVWHVRGTLPQNTKGGTAVVEISKKSGEILRVSHGK